MLISQELRSDQLMAILKREITQSKTLSGPLFKCLCDSLINCATYTTTDDIVQQHTFNVMVSHLLYSKISMSCNSFNSKIPISCKSVNSKLSMSCKSVNSKIPML